MNELWHPVFGWEGWYEVSNIGRVRSIARTILHPKGVRQLRGRLLSPSSSSKGYAIVHLCRQGQRVNRSIHRLVAQAFIGLAPDGAQVLHGNGDKWDNRVTNLRYGNQSDNERDKIFAGNSNRGSRNRTARLTACDVLTIRRALAAGQSASSLAREYGVAKPTIFDIKTRRSWGWLDGVHLREISAARPVQSIPTDHTPLEGA